MRFLRGGLGCLFALMCAAWPGCGQTTLDGVPDAGASVGDVMTGDGTTGGPTAVGGTDPAADPDPTIPTQPLPPDARVAARVRNESTIRADVTVRFIQDDTVVRLAFVRVLPSTMTTVVSPEPADVVELSGVDEQGVALTSERFLLGAGSNVDAPIEYVIRDDRLDVPPVEPPIPGEIVLIEPANDVTLTLGSALRVRWIDASSEPDAVVRIFLRLAAASTLLSVGPAVGASLDGPNDQLVIILQDLSPGIYEIIGELEDGDTITSSTAPGMIEILLDPINEAPTLELTEPAVAIQIDQGGALAVRWIDSDADDNARISLWLDPDLAAAAFDGDEILLASSLGEDVDGVGDQITLGITAEPGDYRVAGTISDGLSEVTVWAPGVVTVSGGPPVEPDILPPELSFVTPTELVKTRLGDPLELFLEALHVTEDSQVRLFLVFLGGDRQGERIALAPAKLVLNAPTTVPLPAATEEEIPNAYWPRHFRLEAEATTPGFAPVVEAAPGEVWIRQEVEITSVRMVNYRCTGAIEPEIDCSRFFGVDVQWFGGGFEERETHGEVAFWIAEVDHVSESLKRDRTHLILHRMPESPNVPRVTELSVSRLIVEPVGVDNSLELTIKAGTYQFITETTTNLFGPITSQAHPDPFEICLLPTPVFCSQP